jgi:hypothetical protein
MTSLRQIEANRHNALKSTGPRTQTGKEQSRRNALRHGLTAETVIEPLEDPESYQTFEGAVVAEYLPQSPVEKELVHRLASLFWRLRRATSIETGLLRLQNEMLQSFRSSRQKTIDHTAMGKTECAGTAETLAAIPRFFRTVRKGILRTKPTTRTRARGSCCRPKIA